MKKFYLSIAILFAVLTANAQENSTSITISTTNVGASDYSNTWWTAFSDYFSVPVGKILHLEFTNLSGCASTGNNWENWVLIAANAARDVTGYSEYFALRSDAYGWGSNYISSNLSNDYPDSDSDSDVWDDFRDVMSNATVTLVITHLTDGTASITASAAGANGTTITETFSAATSSTEDIVTFITCEKSYLTFNSAYLTSAVTTAIENATAEKGNVVSTEYYSIKGVKVCCEYENLQAGIYIKKATYENGDIETTKIFKY